MKKMLVVDGNSILNRAFYGIRLLSNQEGLYTNAVYGMVTMISRHLENLKPDYCAVAFDLKAPTFRHKMYDGYKANRKGMPEELAVQLPYAKECMSDMGLHVVTCEGYEADDILGTLASSMGKQGIHVYLLTGDRDSLQLINENVSVLLAKTKETLLLDVAEFRCQYGISPSYFVEVKALMGDASDNIPGVAGIGEKTALKLISKYHTVENLYQNIETAELSENIRRKLNIGKDMAFLSRSLAEICQTAPISIDSEDYRYLGSDPVALKQLFVRLNFTGLLKRFGLETVSAPGETDTVVPTFSEPFRQTDSLESLEGETVFADISEQKISLFDGTYVWSRPITKDNAQKTENFLLTKKLVCYDAKQLRKDLFTVGAKAPTCFFDCMLAAYVLDSGRGDYTFGALWTRYMDMPLPSEVPMPVLVKGLYDRLYQNISDGEFGSLLFDIEIPLAYVLADMELAGFKIDSDGIQAYGEVLQETAQALQSRIYQYAGETFNIGSPKQLGEILFEKMELPKSKKKKTGYSTDAETLQKLIPYHPIIEDILDYRQVTKLKSTYADGLLKAVDANGRVHSALNQTGTATGRLSSSEPNLQNIPVKTELGKQFRKFFVPQNEEYVLIDADYSQIELRLLAHISDDHAMIESFLSGEDIHAATAARVFNVPLSMVTPALRKEAKAVNFGIMYGMGEYSLSEDLGISRRQAKEYIDSYFEKFPNIRIYLDKVKEQAKKDGYTTTLFGRRRYIPELASSNKNLQHFGERVAMNSPIQGTAADIIKLAMIRVTEQLKKYQLDATLILQVHDELLIEAHRDCAESVKNILIDCMENAVHLSVPLSVDAHIGNSWFDAK